MPGIGGSAGGNLAAMLVQHGTADHLVPWAQSEEFVAAQKEKGLSERVFYIPLDGADHEDKRFFQPKSMGLVFDFIEQYL